MAQIAQVVAAVLIIVGLSGIGFQVHAAPPSQPMYSTGGQPREFPAGAVLKAVCAPSQVAC